MIYCVEDDTSIRELIVYTLQKSGYEASGFSSAKELYEALDRHIPQLVILDIMLPDKDGFEIIEDLKTDIKYNMIPIIFASAKTSEQDKVKGLDLGADDYLSKPFGMMEMVSRVKAVLRRDNRNKHNSLLRFKDLELDADKMEVKIKDKVLDLTLKEFDLLKCFMENPEIVFSREKLLEKIWEEEFLGESRTIDVHIGTLRNKLGDYASYIQTIHGVGYCLKENDVK